MKLLTIKLVILLFLPVSIACGRDDSGSNDGEMGASESTTDSPDQVLQFPDDSSLEMEFEEESPPCAPGKLCPGMTREEVLALLGDPLRIDDYGFGHNYYYIYNNADQDIDLCTTIVLDCKLRFNTSGILIAQQYIKVSYLDILKW